MKPVLEDSIKRYNHQIVLFHTSKQSTFDEAQAGMMMRKLIDLFAPTYSDRPVDILYVQDEPGIQAVGNQVSTSITIGDAFLSGIDKKSLTQKGQQLQEAVKGVEQRISEKEKGMIETSKKARGDDLSPQSNIQLVSQLIEQMLAIYLPQYQKYNRIIGFAENGTGVDVKGQGQHVLDITVGKSFLNVPDTKDLKEKAKQLETAILGAEFQMKGPQRIRQFIRTYI